VNLSVLGIELLYFFKAMYEPVHVFFTVVVSSQETKAKSAEINSQIN
jgi:hypothetical protein